MTQINGLIINSYQSDDSKMLNTEHADFADSLPNARTLICNKKQYQYIMLDLQSLDSEIMSIISLVKRHQPSAQIVCSSANVSLNLLSRAQEAGVHYFIVKPITFAKVSLVMKKLAKHWQVLTTQWQPAPCV